MKKIVISLVIFGTLHFSLSGKNPLHTVRCKNYKQIESYFRYRPDGRMIVSGHRGGTAPGYPENCIETFEYTLSRIPSFFEIDPCLTRDSMIVLMHDPTLNRTTTGKGKVSDYTYAELQQFNLVDRWGNVTPYKIPLVSDVIRWSRDKTILNFDKKDVPRPMLIRLVNELRAKNVIYTVHNAKDALECIAADPEAHFSAWIRNMEEFRQYDVTGIPWSRFIVYVVGSTMKPEQQELYDTLHRLGVRCMISVAPAQDHLPDVQSRRRAYAEQIAKKPDIIETDFPVEFIGLY